MVVGSFLEEYNVSLLSRRSGVRISPGTLKRPDQFRTGQAFYLWRLG